MTTFKSPVEQFRDHLESVKATLSRANNKSARMATNIIQALITDFDTIFSYQDPLDSIIAKHCFLDIRQCPICGRELRKRKGKFGEFLGCSGFPTCKGSRGLDGRATPSNALKAFLLEREEEATAIRKIENSRFSNIEM